MKQIETLIPDIYKVIEGKGGWDNSVTNFFSENLAKLVKEKIESNGKDQEFRLRPSNLGMPCERKLWFDANEPLDYSYDGKTLGNFIYGDILEIFVISLAMASGHRVEGLQQELDICGLSGAGDVVIDGMVVDVKSVSTFSFSKFFNNKLVEEDAFGYLSQLSSYLYGYRNDPKVLYRDSAAFLAVNKNTFDLHLSVHNLKDMVEAKPQEIQRKRDVIKLPEPPEVPFEDVEEIVNKKETGNRLLPNTCKWCARKKKCWDFRTFQYSTGPKYFTHVEKEPKVKEIK